MVNDTHTFGIDPTAGDPLQALALGYAAAEVRLPLNALFALDATLAQVVRTTTQPIIGQMRLAWWRKAIEQLAAGPAPAQPILQVLAGAKGIATAQVAALVEPWEALVTEALPVPEAMRWRGEALFTVAATLLGASPHDPVGIAGAGWASRDEALLDVAMTPRWSAPARALGAMALAVRLNLRDAGPSAVLRMLAFRLTGR